jgi:hypothetical protein
MTMPRVLLSAVALVLATVLASPVAAGAASRPTSSYNASVYYQSDPTLLGIGVHKRMWIRYSTDGSSQVAQVSGDGWENLADCYMCSDWAWAYEKVYSMEPAVGGVSRTLKDAWVRSDTLEFQCWTGECPPMPAKITVEVHWTSTGPVTADVTPDMDSLGVEWLRISRTRPATATIEFSYPAGSGPVLFPALLVGVSISSYNFVTTKS